MVEEKDVGIGNALGAWLSVVLLCAAIPIGVSLGNFFAQKLFGAYAKIAVNIVADNSENAPSKTK